MDILTEHQIQIDFLLYCKEGNLLKVKEYTEKHKDVLEYEFNLGVHTAGQHKRNDIVKYLLTEEKIKQYVDIHFAVDNQEDSLFIDACKKNNLELVEYLSNSTDLKEHSNIHIDKEKPLIEACRNGNLNIIKYLLTSPQLHNQKRAKINVNNGNAFIAATENNHFEVIEYLTSSKDLKEHSDIHAKNDSGFKNLIIFPDLSTIQYLIFQLSIEKTIHIEAYLNHIISKEKELNSLDFNMKEKINRCKEIFDLFEKRDNIEKLEEKLPSKNIVKNKKKI